MDVFVQLKAVIDMDETVSGSLGFETVFDGFGVFEAL